MFNMLDDFVTISIMSYNFSPPTLPCSLKLLCHILYSVGV